MKVHQRVVSFVKYSFRIAFESKEAMVLELGVKCIVTGEVSNYSVDRDKWLAVVNTAMNLWVPLNSGKLLSYIRDSTSEEDPFPLKLVNA